MTDRTTDRAPRTTGSASLADRYGRRPARRGGRLVAAVAIGVLVLGGVGWAAWAAFGPRNAVRWQDGGFAVVDDGHARLSFAVTVGTGRQVVCTVRMFNDGMTEVGRLDVTAGPSAERTFSVTASVPTFEEATSGSVRACALRK